MQVIKPRSFQGPTEEKQQCKSGVVVLIEGFQCTYFSVIVIQGWPFWKKENHPLFNVLPQG